MEGVWIECPIYVAYAAWLAHEITAREDVALRARSAWGSRFEEYRSRLHSLRVEELTPDFVFKAFLQASARPGFLEYFLTTADQWRWQQGIPSMDELRTLCVAPEFDDFIRDSGDTGYVRDIATNVLREALAVDRLDAYRSTVRHIRGCPAVLSGMIFFQRRGKRPYILEGHHRAVALHLIDLQDLSFPPLTGVTMYLATQT